MSTQALPTASCTLALKHSLQLPSATQLTTHTHHFSPNLSRTGHNRDAHTEALYTHQLSQHQLQLFFLLSRTPTDPTHTLHKHKTEHKVLLPFSPPSLNTKQSSHTNSQPSPQLPWTFTQKQKQKQKTKTLPQSPHLLWLPSPKNRNRKNRKKENSPGSSRQLPSIPLKHKQRPHTHKRLFPHQLQPTPSLNSNPLPPSSPRLSLNQRATTAASPSTSSSTTAHSTSDNSSPQRTTMATTAAWQ